jgi:hypothetical protein
MFFVVLYKFKEIVDSQITKFKPFFRIEIFEKCHLLKRRRVTVHMRHFSSVSTPKNCLN